MSLCLRAHSAQGDSTRRTRQSPPARPGAASITWIERSMKRLSSRSPGLSWECGHAEDRPSAKSRFHSYRPSTGGRRGASLASAPARSRSGPKQRSKFFRRGGVDTHDNLPCTHVARSTWHQPQVILSCMGSSLAAPRVDGEDSGLPIDGQGCSTFSVPPLDALDSNEDFRPHEAPAGGRGA
jgi:hypothetical protein